MIEDSYTYLGKGTTRLVYYVPGTTLICKKENYPLGICNQKEFDVWKFVKGTEVEKYFLPVESYDPDNRLIYFNFIEDVTPELMKQMELPYNFTDDYILNFGQYKNRVVIRDYADIVIGDSLLDLAFWHTPCERKFFDYRSDYNGQYNARRMEEIKKFYELLPDSNWLLANRVSQASEIVHSSGHS